MNNLKDIHEQLSIAINILIKQKDISMYRVSKAGKISQSALSEIVSGKNTNPTIETISKIASGIGITVIELMQKAEEAGKGEVQELSKGLKTEAECLLEKRICSFIEYYSEMVDEDIKFISDEQLFEKFKNFAIIMEWDYPPMTTTAFIYRCPIISRCITKRVYSIESIKERIIFDKDESEK